MYIRNPGEVVDTSTQEIQNRSKRIEIDRELEWAQYTQHIHELQVVCGGPQRADFRVGRDGRRGLEMCASWREIWREGDDNYGARVKWKEGGDAAWICS